MDVVSFLLGKNSGGGSGGTKNAYIEASTNYTSSQGIRAFIKRIDSFEIPSELTTLESLFMNCIAIEEIPVLNLKNVTSIAYACNACYAIVSAPAWDTKNITAMGSTFNNCTNLENVPVYDTSSLEYANNIFQNCGKLTDQSLDNILQMCINATSFLGTKTLKYLGFVKTKYSQAKIESLPHYADFVAAGWGTGY